MLVQYRDLLDLILWLYTNIFFQIRVIYSVKYNTYSKTEENGRLEKGDIFSVSSIFFWENTVYPLKSYCFMIILHIIIASIFNLQLLTFLKLFTFFVSNCYMTYNHISSQDMKCIFYIFFTKSKKKLQFISYQSNLCVVWNLPRQQISANCCVLCW